MFDSPSTLNQQSWPMFDSASTLNQQS
jgi:hypothetical protein